MVALQFDCITPCGPAHHGLGMYDRMIFYVLQQRNNNLQLLCETCHQIKSAQDKFNLRESALAEEKLSSSTGAETTASGNASRAPSTQPLPQQADETDWQYECRRARERWGIP